MATAVRTGDIGGPYLDRLSRLAQRQDHSDHPIRKRSRRCSRDRDTGLSDEVLLGVRFACAMLTHDPDAEELRNEIVRRWGPRALISLAFAFTAARIFPTLKYALGHGRACQRVMVAGKPTTVARRLVEHAPTTP